MPRPKTPLAKAKLTGAYSKHPERYRDIQEPEGLTALGEPPAYLSEPEKMAWATFADELPWLVSSDRALLESACRLRAGIQGGGDVTAAHIRELRMHLTALGGTPTSRHSVQIPEDEDENDPWAQFESQYG
ncbi:hypothetical protein SAMN05444000_1064 [Shimia gijangensis]|uniref:Terminase small subunit n=1 Tax=Shimia gijangensis TaxID=1470563 RepID=A0A1M6HBI4_9RHOB|nr:hypothetical protein [Shimia gijangensis]SHJ19503.1 hypothetical protein SAMN05444000_1064 [Shimia gijangensis]